MSSSSIVLVTGASSGFGAVTAALFAARGHRVFGTSRRGGTDSAGVELLPLDVDDDASVQRCISEIEQRAGRIDIVVNNAGRAMLGAAEETTAIEARALFETNVFGVMRVVNCVLPGMRTRGAGTIINVGSVSGFIGVPFHGVYAATKHALAGYSEALRFELAPFGVRVVLVEPAAHATTIQMVRPAHTLSLYDIPRERVGRVIRDQIERGDDPARVAEAIVAAATTRRPPSRIRIGTKARLGMFARRFFTPRLFDRLMRREFEREPRPRQLDRAR